MKQNRLSYLDSITGFLIIYIIFMHTWPKPHYMSELWLNIKPYFFFMMPWFFFKAGLFHKDTTVRGSLKKILKRLGIPFIVFSLFGQIEWVVEELVKGNVDFYHLLIFPIAFFRTQISFPGNMPLWFLVSLCVTKLVYIGMVNSLKIRLILTFLLSLIAVPILNHYRVDFSNGLYAFPLSVFFYSSGILLRNLQYNKWFVLLCAIMLFAGYTRCFSEVCFSTGVVEEGNYWVWIVMCITANILLSNIFRLLHHYIDHIPLITYIGRNSMIFYVSHIIIIHISIFLLLQFGIVSEEIQFWVTTLVLLILLFLVNNIFNTNKLRFFVGK